MTQHPVSSGAAPQGASPVPDAPAVRVHTLGRFVIEVGDETLRFESKAKRKPLELLKVLVALGGESVPVEQLLESLWPDSDGDRAHSAFTTNLGRLRKLIGAEPLSLQDGRLTLDARRCWLDTWAFTGHLRQAVRALEADATEEAREHMEQALALYRGPFLDGEFDPPELLSARERLHGQFLRHIERLGDLLVERGDYAHAAELYQQGLEVDDLAEELYQHLIRCYLAQGRLVEGVAVYKRCKQLFRASVGIDPSPETEALHQALLAAQPAQAAQAAQPVAPTPRAPAAPATVPPPAADADLPDAAPALAPAGPSPEGERRTATIACFALTGYAALNSALDPEEVEELMLGLRRETERVVQRHGGILNETVRNEMHALFGLPGAHEDDPVRAVRAALELQALVRELCPQYEPRIGEQLRLRAGVHTGLMVIHPRGERADRFDVTGDAVNLGAELMALAPPDEVLVGPETRRQIAYFFETEPAEAVTLAGRARPVTPHRISGRLDVATRFEAAARRGLTDFTGRESELAVLQACMERARAGEGQFVTVVGEPGLGKSRLLHEFQRSLHREEWMVLECRTQAAGGATPYGPFLDGLRRGLGLRETDTPAELLDKVVRNIRAVDPALEPYLPFYLYLLSIPSAEHPLPGNLAGGELRQALQEAIAALGIQSTHRRPMMLLFEDWHWVDGASMDTLRMLVSMMGAHPLMIVVTYRPDFQVDWGHQSHHTNVLLRPLDGEQTAAVLRSVLAARDLPPGLPAFIQERTGGNPFFIEEVCSALREEGALQVTRGRAELTRALEALSVPDTVQAVIRTRVDRLDADAQQTLRLASVIGREFGARLLAHLAAQDVDLHDCLERLKNLELIQQIQVLPDALYRFKHTLTQTVVYETLLRQQRRKLHGHVGAALEALHADRLEEHYEALAHHYQRSNDPAKALHYLERAGDKAAQSSALASARAHYRAAIELADTLAPTPELKRTRIDLSLKWADAAQYAPTQGMIEMLSVSLAYARELADPERQASAIYWRGRLLYVLGRLSLALAEFQEVGRFAEALGHPGLTARYTGFMGRYCWHAAEYERAMDHLRRALGLMEGLGSADDVLYLESMLGTVYGWCGRLDEGIALLDSVIARAREEHNPTRESAATVFLAMVRALRGDWGEAAALARAGHERAERLGNAAISSMGRWTCGYATFMLGEREQGRALMEDIVHWPQDGRPGRMLVFCAWLAEMEALAGRAKSATALARLALEMPERIGHRTGLPVAHRALGLAAMLGKSPRWPDALHHLREGIAVAEATGARPEAAIGHLRLAEALAAQGDGKAARSELAQASAAFQALGMPWWQGQAEAVRVLAPAASAKR